MNTSQSRESVVFDFRTLRMIIGALAFAFPVVVYALTGKITTSISASYHEPQTRDVFVGFLFILGALLLSYKGHRLWVSFGEGSYLWVWLRRHQEDCISALGGIAAIFTALFPTACDDCSFDTRARIHTIGAFILFSNVAYFAMIAFLRSLNKKLQTADELSQVKYTPREELKSRFLRFIYPLISEILLFRNLVREAAGNYDKMHLAQGQKPSSSYRKEKFTYLMTAYREKIFRGFVYVICGSLITLILVIFVPTSLALPRLVAQAKMTFVIETVALWLFGAAWMTAAHIPYLRKIRLLLAFRRKKQVFLAEPGTA